MLKEQKIINLMLFHGPMGPDALREESGISRSDLYRTISKMISNNIIKKYEKPDVKGTRILYKAIPKNIPPVVAQDFRSKMETLIGGVSEFSSSGEPDKTQAFKTFVESGIFDFDEMMSLKKVYQMSWKDLAFLIPEESGEELSPGKIAMLLKPKESDPKSELSDKMSHSPGYGPCPNLGHDAFDHKGGNTGNTPCPRLGHDAFDLKGRMEGPCPKLGHDAFGLYYTYTRNNIINNIYKAEGGVSQSGTQGVKVFMEEFKSLFQGILFHLPGKEKKTLSEKSELFGKIILKVLLDSPPPSGEEKEIPSGEIEGTPSDEVAALKNSPVKKVPFKKPMGLGVKKETPPVDLPRSSAITKEDEVVAEGRMHPNYWGMDSYERDFEFAKIYVDLVSRVSSHLKETYTKILGTESMYRFRRPRKKNCVDNRKDIHASRVQADVHGARYEEWIKARIELWSPERNFNVPYPTPHYLTSREHWEIWCGFMSVGNGKEYITYDRAGLEAIGIPCLLPENFHADGHLEKAKARDNNPETNQEKRREYDLQCKLYEDYIYADMLRVHGSSGWDILELAKKAICKKIIPADWVMGYGTHHNLPELKQARYLIKL